MRRYITREDAVFAACKVLDKFGGCKMGPLCPDVGCCEVRDIIDTFPMIEIPEKHGRLIDADKIGLTNFEIILCQKGNPFKNALEMLFEKIEAAPTIIPAEEESSEYTD